MDHLRLGDSMIIAVIERLYFRPDVRLPTQIRCMAQFKHKETYATEHLRSGESLHGFQLFAGTF